MSPVLAFGDDRSVEAGRAWGWISSHRWEGWTLEVISAEPSAGMPPVSDEAAELVAWEPDEPRDPSGLGFESSEHLRVEVDPRVALISKDWDLVVVGPRGSTGLKSLHLGSTADWLLRAPASPLVVARQPGPVRRVLVTTDGSGDARRAIDALAGFPWLEGVAIRVVTVAERRVDTRSALDGAADLLAGSGAEVDTATIEGRPTPAIVSQIDSYEPDLTVMGARGHGRMRRLLLGSTTAAVAGSVDRSILVAHAAAED